jgi:hypothetical protein
MRARADSDRTRGFCGVIAVSVLAGLVIQYSAITPIKALFWSAVINGVVAVPLMAVIILLVSKKTVMGAFTAGRPIIILGWIATAVMGAAAVRMFIRIRSLPYRKEHPPMTVAARLVDERQSLPCVKVRRQATSYRRLPFNLQDEVRCR